MNIGKQMIYGSSAMDNATPSVKDAVLRFGGIAMDGATEFGLDEEAVSRHILLLGGSGCGKTNTFLHAVRATMDRLTQDDVILIFDTKGEYYQKFHRPGDLVLGNAGWIIDQSCTWNIFGDVIADGWDDMHVTMNAREMAASLFLGRGSTTQPFFCNAAKDFFRAILVYFIRRAVEDPANWRGKLNNRALVDWLLSATKEDYLRVFNSYPDMKSLISYIGDGTSNQALGVFAELNSMVSDYFVGIFAEYRPNRSISIRNTIRGKGGRILFIEYDLSMGETLAPVYRLLLDLGFKEALVRKDKTGHFYVFADEFKLIPLSRQIDDVLNFGREQRVSVMAGIQSIDQLYAVYGQEKGAVLAGGFGNLFAFHTNDHSSREYITKRLGQNLAAYTYWDDAQKKNIYREREGYTVEHWDQINLGRGQAFISVGYSEPFLFEFQRF